MLIFRFIHKYGGDSLSHLSLLQDKDVFRSIKKSVMISYTPKGNKYYVIGDPFGEQEDLDNGLKEFMSFAKNHRVTPIFYQASSRFFHIFKENGYRIFKVGEEAKVCLETFTIQGKKSGKFRTTLNKFEREGFIFTIVYPPFTSELIEELKCISDEWLNGRKEKSFSVSSFSNEYIGFFPISTLRDRNGKLIAFASLPSDKQENETVSIDLMRSSKDSPPGAMDMVFISTFLWAKDKGYKSCSLGLSPLSNVGIGTDATLMEKIARYVFFNSCRFYNFRGLKSYKAKFATEWIPRYVVYKRTPLLLVMIKVILLVNKPIEHKRILFTEKWFSDKKIV
ncbi:phosphatidylglycerol lysyltransferase domain-containing protein [Bacillus weihaiensis]|uniref:phosphatidylglycerol lysyltransferase domain-containing protein n=1 Tax=Bacillus weihaiensis TaxID=1547283 RepID=UPI0023540490|nr:phosphatidylglycerol lysyltransferase domain-containing protein [Bacillus weihaiensis]